MLSFPWNSRFAFCVGIFVAIGTSACNNSCFVAFSNNGSSSVTIQSGSQPQTCSLSQAMGTMSVAALRTRACEFCSHGSSVEHVFVTLRGIRLRANATVDPNPLELAPGLASEPRQIDLLGSSPETLVESAVVPAGAYSSLELEFSSAPPADAEHQEQHSGPNACGLGLRNCIVMSDGQVEPLGWANESATLVLSLQSLQSSPLVLLPDAKIELRLHLEPRLAYRSQSEPWQVEHLLVGTVEASARTTL